MRRFLIVLLACALGLVAAFAFSFVAGIVRPCGGERLSCSMTEVVGVIYSLVFAGVALVTYSVAMIWKGTHRAVAIALLIPLAPFLCFFAYLKMSELFVRELHDIRERDIQEILLVGIPIVLTLIVPWLVLRSNLRRGGNQANANG